MAKIKLYTKEKVIDGIVNVWFEDAEGKEIDVAPEECFKCTERIWSGHVTSVGNVYCITCFNERHDEATRNLMHEAGEQYYTEWTDEDLDKNMYEVIPVVPFRMTKY